MTKVSNTQAILLSAAAQRADGNLLPLPGSLRGGAAVKVVGALLARGLAREEVTDRMTRADSALNTIWRNDDDGRGVLLFVTPAGLEAIGVEADSSDDRAPPPAGVHSADQDGAGVEGAPAARSATPVRKTREGTKQALLIEMLQRPEGATIEQIIEVTGWLPHTVRGAFAGALRKRMGIAVASEKVEGRGRVYRVEA